MSFSLFKTTMNHTRAFLRINRLYHKRKFHIETYKCQSDTNSKYSPCIFSGIQPTGSVHLGNYLGAINYWKKFQEEYNCVIFSIVDLHSITLPQDPKQLFNNILEMTATLLACGIDYKKCILFQQSQIPQHTELCWQLACLTTMPRLAHLPQYKEKSASLKDIPLGLFIYPVLQTADILMYKGTHVPVGEDQKQHLQLAQDLARMFNKKYGEIFPIPHSIIAGESICRLKSLRNPTKKMSKSDQDPKSRINLTDSPEDILNKFKKSVTDFTSEVFYDTEKRPGVSNLISIHSAITGKSMDEIIHQAKGINTGRYKLEVAEDVIQHLKPIRLEIKKLLNDPGFLINVLDTGTERAISIADKTIQEVRNCLGLRYNVKNNTSMKIDSS